MVSAFVAAILVGQAADAPRQAAPLVSKMFARYAEAKTLVGRITLTQSMAGQAGRIETVVQYERPSKLYIQQSYKGGARPRAWLACSNGAVISYDAPEELPMTKGQRLVESQVQEGKAQTIQAVYQVVSHSLGDRSVPLDAAIGNVEFLKFMRNQWATMSLQGQVKLGDEDVYLVTGQWRDYKTVAVRGIYEIYLTEQGDLRRYVIKQDVVFDKTQPPQRLTSTWDADLKVGAPPEAGIFKVYR